MSEREALAETGAVDHEFIVIGAGVSGLYQLHRLRELGADVLVLERNADVGGTWFRNRYPGCRFDSESYSYAYSFSPELLQDWDWSEHFAAQPETLRYLRHVADRFALRKHIAFGESLRAAHFEDASATWRLELASGRSLRCRFLVTAIGVLSAATRPSYPGMASFRGPSFHTEDWPHDGIDLRGKRVAIIGTGATAIQCVPFLGAHAKQLFVFQRTPSSVDLRGNKPTDPAWARSLKPGWQRARRENFNDVVTGRPFDVDLVSDAWTDIFRSLASNTPISAEKEGALPQAEELAELADFQKMNQIRARVDAEVRDRPTAEALKPWYRQFCKRPTFNDEYLATFNRPNVQLVDVSDTRGVERITKRGIVANGALYEVDCIVFSTGFEIGTAPRRRIGFEIFGRDGRSLYDYWKDGLRTLHGFSVHGFPNWFFIGISQNGVSVNMTSMFDDQAKHVAYVIREANARRAKTVRRGTGRRPAFDRNRT